MRFSSFFAPSARSLKGLGDVACERNLLKQLAAQFFYNLTGTAAESQASLEAFLHAYLGSREYAANPVFPVGEGLLFLLQSYMVEFLGDSPNADTLLAVSPLTTENLTTWSGRVDLPYVQPRTRVQAEAAVLLCQTPAVDPAAATRATADRARRDAETARVAAATAASTATTATGTPASAAARAEAAVAAVAAAVAAQFATTAAAATAALGTPTTPRPPNTSVLIPGTPSWLVLTPAQRAAILAAQYGNRSEEESTISGYLPYIAGGGLLLLAAVVFAAKSPKKGASGQVST